MKSSLYKRLFFCDGVFRLGINEALASVPGNTVQKETPRGNKRYEFTFIWQKNKP